MGNECYLLIGKNGWLNGIFWSIAGWKPCGGSWDALINEEVGTVGSTPGEVMQVRLLSS
jgi:hypothetical protein